jgi:hypothetical protein
MKNLSGQSVSELRFEMSNFEIHATRVTTQASLLGNTTSIIMQYIHYYSANDGVPMNEWRTT